MTQTPGRVMSLDVGGRRIGVALSDETRLLASPYTTLRAEPRAVALQQIVELVRREAVALLVIGLPLTMSGEIGPQAQLVRAFRDELERLLSIPIVEFDERLTTVEADRILAEAGVKPDRRKAKIDEVAAWIILRDYLETQRKPTPPHEYDEEPWDI